MARRIVAVAAVLPALLAQAVLSATAVSAADRRLCPVSEFAVRLADGYMRDVAFEQGAGMVAVGDRIHGHQAVAIIVTRRTASGAADRSFGGNGTVVVDDPDPETTFGSATVAVAPGGRVVVGGSWFRMAGGTGGRLLVALGADGRVDQTFGVGGFVKANDNDVIENVVALPDGSFIAQSARRLARYSPTGVPSPVFDVTAARDTAFNDLLLDGERVLVTVLDRDDVHVHAYRVADGAPDPTFGTGGRSVIDLGSAVDAPRGIAVRRGGYVVSAVTRGVASAVGLTRSGASDRAFGQAGMVVLHGFNDLMAPSTTPDGGVAIATSTGSPGDWFGARSVVTLSPAGRVRILSVSASIESWLDLRVRPDGTIALIGGTTGREFLAPAVGIVSEDCGYWLAASDGGIFSFAAPFYGSAGGLHLQAPVVAGSRSPTTSGYWLAAGDGGVFTFRTGFYGSAGALGLRSPIVDMASTPTGDGYWLVAADGGVFAFGNAMFRGSMGGRRLNAPIIAIVAGADGYALVAADGGVFNFGSPFTGQTLGNRRLNAPIVDAAAAGGGLLLAARDGGVFALGPAPFRGSAGSLPLKGPIAAIAVTAAEDGYWLAGADGGVFAFNAPFAGSTGALRLRAPIVDVFAE